MTTPRPELAIIGPGAIGAAVAGAALQAGRKPLIAARTPISTIEVKHPGGTVEGEVVNLADPAAVTPVDMVLLAVKAHQTTDAAPWLAALVDRHSTIVVLQNGVEHADRIAPFVDAQATVVPAVVALPAHRLEPGQVEVGGTAQLTVPRGPGANRLQTLLAESFIDVRIVDNWLDHAWSKLMLNAAAGGICVFSQSDSSIFEHDTEAGELVLAMLEEVAAVGRAAGAQLAADLPQQMLELLPHLDPGHRSSIVIDRANGVATEWDARNSVIPRIAARHGIAVPHCATVATLLRLSEPAAGNLTITS